MWRILLVIAAQLLIKFTANYEVTTVKKPKIHMHFYCLVDIRGGMVAHA